MDDFGRQSSESSENHPENVFEHHYAFNITSQVQNLNIRGTRYLEPTTCLPCGLFFERESDYHEHSNAEEHDIMKLVTGMAAYEEVPDDASDFKPLYYCVLCNVFCFDFNVYEAHLKEDVHKEMSQTMAITSFCRKNIVVGYRTRELPVSAKDFQNLMNCPPYYCQLCDKQCNGQRNLEDHTKGQRHMKFDNTAKNCVFCNITFVNSEMYDFHLRTEEHARIEVFMRKMALTRNERMTTPKKQSSADATPRPSIYYCKLCNIEFNDVEYFRRHRNIGLHKRIEKLVNKLSITMEIEGIPDNITGSLPRIHYCELCKEWCSDSTVSYANHVQTGEHLLRRSHYKVRNWDCSPDK